MTKKVKDPFAAREAQKYDNPIPSRECIIELIEEQGNAMAQRSIAVQLQIAEDDEDHREALRRRLRAMVRDGQLVRNRRGAYGLVGEGGLLKGRFIAHRDGYGFIVPQEGGGDLYLNAHEAKSVFHDDEVLVRVSGMDQKGRREAMIVEVLQRNTQQVVGRYFKKDKIGIVEPAGKRIKKQIIIPLESTKGVKDGQFVLVTLVQQPTKHNPAIGEVIEVVGDHMAPGMEIDVAIRSYQLPVGWSAEVNKELDAIADHVQEKDLEGRKDLRNLPLVTIDGEDAKDFDDAVFCEKTKTGWRLFVAIADVSHYVKSGSALDEEAYARGNSVYFPGRVIPMLPEKLSNGLCSLNPKVDRLCVVGEMTISAAGKMTRSKFYSAVMHSKARLTYTHVGEFLEKGEGSVPVDVQPHIQELHKLYQALNKSRQERGAIELDTVETMIVFGKDKKIENIVPTKRNVAHKIIEECMLSANVAAAKLVEKYELINLYRIHEQPSEEKIEKLRGFLGELGLRFAGNDAPCPKDYSDLLDRVRDRPDFHIIQLLLLRTFSQAKYSPDNSGHFGLAYKAYAHFTSPIRRYPDLLIHRAIKASLLNQHAYEDANVMADVGVHCSDTERRADEATRDVTEWLKCEYMIDKVGKEFDGVISAVTPFGFFVELKDIYVEGLVHITALDKDYFIYDPVRHQLKGEKTGLGYHLGDTVKVRVDRVDLDDRQIDFGLITKKKRKDKK